MTSASFAVLITSILFWPGEIAASLNSRSTLSCKNKPSVWTPPDPWTLLWGEAFGDDLGFLARRCQLIFISSNQTVHFLSSSSLSPQRRQFPVSAAALPRLLPSSSAQEGSFHVFRGECDGLKTDDVCVCVCVCVCSQPCGVSCFYLLWSRE